MILCEASNPPYTSWKEHKGGDGLVDLTVEKELTRHSRIM